MDEHVRRRKQYTSDGGFVDRHGKRHHLSISSTQHNRNGSDLQGNRLTNVPHAMQTPVLEVLVQDSKLCKGQKVF